jgi:hypothetical protein
VQIALAREGITFGEEQPLPSAPRSLTTSL